MVRQDFSIDGYWDVIVVYNVELGELNSGFTHTDFNKKLSIVGIGKATSKRQFFNTIIHEVKHLQSHICKYYNVPEDGEQAAYLVGYIASKIYSNIREYLC